MKRIPVDECPAGLALDAAIAKARDWLESPEGYWMYPDGRLTEYKYREAFSDDSPYFCPSTDITAAWELVELALEYANDFELQWDGAKDGWMCYIAIEPAKARTAPLAIARAYLKAKGVEYVEVPDD